MKQRPYRPKRITIQPGNSKLGKVPNISLPPILTCIPDPPCRDVCYAYKFWKLRRGCRESWSRNLAAYYDDPVEYFNEIQLYLSTRPQVEMFRWHVSGDFPDPGYLVGTMNTAYLLPNVKFLAFTKRPWDFSEVPPNLGIMFSVWPTAGQPLPTTWKGIRGRAYTWLKAAQPVLGGADIPICHGGCDKCQACFTRRGDVMFKQH